MQGYSCWNFPSLSAFSMLRHAGARGQRLAHTAGGKSHRASLLCDVKQLYRNCGIIRCSPQTELLVLDRIIYIVSLPKLQNMAMSKKILEKRERERKEKIAELEKLAAQGSGEAKKKLAKEKRRLK